MATGRTSISEYRAFKHVVGHFTRDLDMCALKLSRIAGIS